MTEPVRVAVTGAAGQIGYALVFRIASGQMLGAEQPVILHLLEIPPAMDALRGVVMELDDCAFPLVQGVVETSEPNEAFDGVEVALLVGSRPRGPGMERNELLQVNAEIFSVQGKALNERADRNAKVLVVGNPANTNCLIALKNAPDLSPNNFTAMTRLDHNRALAQLASKTGQPVDTIRGLAIWGNHSSTMFPDLTVARVGDTPALQLVDSRWYEDEFLPVIQQRGAAIIAARGASSAASAANAAIDHVRDWVLGSDSVTSMAVYGSGAYGIDDDLVFSYPVRCGEGSWTVELGRELDDFSRRKIRETEQELLEEREAIAHLI